MSEKKDCKLGHPAARRDRWRHCRDCQALLMRRRRQEAHERAHGWHPATLVTLKGVDEPDIRYFDLRRYDGD